MHGHSANSSCLQPHKLRAQLRDRPAQRNAHIELHARRLWADETEISALGDIAAAAVLACGGDDFRHVDLDVSA